MILYNPRTTANHNGIPRVESTGSIESGTNFVITFQNGFRSNNNFNGLVLIKINPFTAPSAASNVLFEVNGTNQTVTDFKDTVIQAGGSGTFVAGIYLAYYDGDCFKLLTGV